MFKYNKITAFWAAGVAASLFGGLALAAEETIVVTAGSGEDPTAPLKGIVATKTLSATKTAAEIVKTPQSVSVVTRDQMRALDVTSVSRRCAIARAFLPNTEVHLTATTRYSYAASATCPNSLMA